MNLIYARERLWETNAMDIGSVGDELCMEDVGTVNKDTKCYRCDGCGHVAIELGHAQGRWKRVERIGAEERQGT